MQLEKFKLLKEDGENYHVGHPSGKTLVVSKKGMSEKAHAAIKKLSPQNFDEGGEVSMGEESVPAGSQDQLPFVSENQGVLATPSEPTPSPAIIPTPYAQDAPPAAPTPVPRDPATPAAADPLASQATEETSALQKARDAISKGADAEAAAGSEEAKAYSKYDQDLAKLPTPQEIFDKHKAKDDALLDAYANSKIDPNHFWADKSTGSKILAGVGIALGGIGAGKTGQPNYALESINKAIDRDVDSQKANQSKAMNLWKMNREATGDETQATLLTQNQMLNAVKAQVMKAGAQASSSMAKARIAPLLLEIDSKMAKNRMQVALSQANGQNGGASNMDPASLVASLVPATHQKEVFKEIGQAQNAAKNKDAVMKAFDDANNQNSVLSTNAPGALATAAHLRTPAPVLAMRALTLPIIHDNEGRVNEFEQKTLLDLEPRPFDTAAKVAAKRQALEQFIDQKRSAPTAKGFGINLDRFSSTSGDATSRFTPQQKTFLEWAKKNPENPKAALVLKKLGVR